MALSKENTFDKQMQFVLDTLELNKYYPEKLTRNEMYQITGESLKDSEPSSLQDLGWYFLEKITRFNYNARDANISVQSTTSTDKQVSVKGKLKRRAVTTSCYILHPLDVLVAIFLCCDAFCKQDLALYLWHCRLAIPLLVPIAMSSKVFIWPLRSIVMRWQVFPEEEAKEYRIVSHKMQSIGFIRLSKVNVSKSDTINCLITGTRKPHPMFFHRGCPGSAKQKHIADGTLEVGWFFPKGVENDLFQHSMRFINMRGAAQEHSEVLKVFIQMSDHIVIFCNSVDLQPSTNTFKEILSIARNLLLVITDDSDRNEDTEKRLDEFERSFKLDDVPEGTFDIIYVEDMQRGNLVEEIRQALQKFKANKMYSFEDILTELQGKKVQIDENESVYVQTKLSAEAILNDIKQVEPMKRKNVLLPLQGLLWESWTSLDKEEHRLKNKDPAEEVTDYQDRLNEKKAKLRRDQLLKVGTFEVGASQECTEIDGAPLRKPTKQHFRLDLTGIISPFLREIDTERLETIPVFLRWFKMMLDDLSRDELSPVFQALKTAWRSKANAKTDVDRCTSEKAIRDMDMQLTKLSFGLEHVVRELGQTYEAVETSLGLIQNMEEMQNTLQRLTFAAGQLLLNGYPLEIMDGDVSAVPVAWVKGVFENVVQHLQKKEGESTRVFILSVLGIQSSGKSTLLNTLFGLQFAVSAGRCTRGVFVQLVKIEEKFREHLKIDYIIAVDTEGLQNPELSSETNRSHDNELTTFVIGLGDLTMVNIMGENTTFLGDFLPISVHAFLRMELLDINRKCIIIHQNVDKCNKDKLLQQGIGLEKTLNEMTSIACKFENIEPREFKEIISFDITTEVFNMPGLLEGEQPMAPISIGYSTEACALRKKIFKVIETFESESTRVAFDEAKTKAKPLIRPATVCLKDLSNERGSLDVKRQSFSKKQSKTLASFHSYISSLWTSIQKDDFVYEFKSIIETQARSALDDELCKRSSQFRDKIKELTSKAYKKIFNSESMQIVGTNRDELKADAHTAINEEYETHFLHLQDFFAGQKSLQKEVIRKWEKDAEHCLVVLREDLEKEYNQKIIEFSADREMALNLDTERKVYETNLVESIRKAAQAERDKGGKELSGKELEVVFESNWANWLDELKIRYQRERRAVFVDTDVSVALEKQMKSHLSLLNEKRQLKPLREYELDDFSVQRHHWQSSRWDLSHAVSKCLKGMGLEKGYDDNRGYVTAIAEKMKHRVKVLISSFFDRREPYHSGMASNVIDIVGKDYESNYVTLTPKFKIEMGVAVAGHAIKELERLHDEDERRKTPTHMAEKGKDNFFLLFTTCINDTNAIGTMVKICLDSIWWCILTTLQHDLPQRLVHEMKCEKCGPLDRIFISKRAMLSNMMQLFLERGEFSQIYQYIADPALSIDLHINNLVKEFCESDYNGGKYIRRKTESMANIMFGIVQEALVGIDADMKEGIELDFSDWKNALHEATGNDLILADLETVVMHEQTLFNVHAFSIEFASQLQEMKATLVYKLGEMFENDPFPRRKMVEELYESTIGCTALCPLCNEICASSKGHLGPHQASVHKPVGCAGVKDANNDQLLTDECNCAEPSRKRLFSKEKNACLSLYEFKTLHPGWTFSTDKDFDAANVWRFIYVQHIEDLTKMFRAKKPRFPKAWTKISKEKEISVLDNYIKSNESNTYWQVILPVKSIHFFFVNHNRPQESKSDDKPEDKRQTDA